MSHLPCTLLPYLTGSEQSRDSRKYTTESCDLSEFLGTAEKGGALH